jgi:hypothetical protein
MSNFSLDITKIYAMEIVREENRQENLSDDPLGAVPTQERQGQETQQKNALWSTKPKVGWRWTSARQQVQDQQ